MGTGQDKHETKGKTMSKIITLTNLDANDTYNDFNANIIAGISIRIHGTNSNNAEMAPKAFDKTFLIGDKCQTDSYNFIYVGTIEKITTKRVRVKDFDGRTRSMTIVKFCQQNYKFDAAKAEAHNTNEAPSI